MAVTLDEAARESPFSWAALTYIVAAIATAQFLLAAGRPQSQPLALVTAVARCAENPLQVELDGCPKALPFGDPGDGEGRLIDLKSPRDASRVLAERIHVALISFLLCFG